MTTTTTKSVFWQGFRDGAPFLLVLAPFSALFGVLATEAGLNVFETLAFSVLVIAGSAQFTALQLMTEDAPTVIVIASALAVNLRMAMYSASLAPHLGAAPLWTRAIVAYLTVDQSYALGAARYEREPDLPLGKKLAYFFGIMTPVVPTWYGFAIVGAWGGQAVPPEFALDFAMPLTFLAMVAPALRTSAHIAAAFVAAVSSLLLIWVPFSLGLLIAAMLGMVTGAQVELWLSKKAQQYG